MALVIFLVILAEIGGLTPVHANPRLQQLRFGARGEAVRQLQTLLSSLGYSPGPIDGIFGRQTELALRRYQRDRGLVVDGTLGRPTLAALERDWQAQRQPAAVPVHQGRKHVVRPGETLQTIAVRYGLTWMDLSRFNHLADPNRVLVGQALFIPEPGWQPVPLPPIALPSPPPVAPRRPAAGAVALTFNGGPHPEHTPAILAALARGQVRATFFVVGSLAEANPGLVKLLAEQGHEVGNQGYLLQNLHGQPLQAIESEISRTSMLVQSLTGRPTSLFRPPGGTLDRNVRLAAARQEHAIVMWTNIGAQTGAGIPRSQLVQRLINHAYDGAVIMLRVDDADTVEVLPELIAALEQRGFAFVTLGRALAAARAIGRKGS